MATPLGDYVRAQRLSAGMTQEALGELAGQSKAYISQVEVGRIAFPNADIRRRLAAALGVSHLDLLIAAGELNPDEVTAAGMVATPVEEDERTAEIVALARQIDWSEPTWYGTEKSILDMFIEQQKRKGKR